MLVRYQSNKPGPAGVDSARVLSPLVSQGRPTVAWRLSVQLLWDSNSRVVTASIAPASQPPDYSTSNHYATTHDQASDDTDVLHWSDRHASKTRPDPKPPATDSNLGGWDC